MSRSESITAAAAPGGSRWYSECSLERRVQDFSANPAAASAVLRNELLRDLVGLADREESEWIAGRFGDDYGAWLRAFADFRDGDFLDPEHRGRLEELEEELDCLEAYFLSFAEVDSNDVVRDAARAHLDLVAGDARGKIETSRREIERFAGGALDERTVWLLKTQMFR